MTASQRRLLPFTGRASIARRYRIIGAALLNVERSHGLWRTTFGFNQSATFPPKFVGQFREAVCLISLEVLESYLEDLLDLEVNEPTLYIKRPGIKVPPSLLLAISGLALALAIGLYTVSIGATFALSFCITAALSLPFALLWHFFPHALISRRLMFARLVSQEISRRRGTDGPKITIETEDHSITELITASRGIQGAAVKIVH